MPLDDERASEGGAKKTISISFLCFTYPGNDHFTHSCTDPTICLIERNQSSASILRNTDGSEGKEGGDPFPWFQARSFSMLLPSSSAANFSSLGAQAQVCLLWHGKVFHTLAHPSPRDTAEKRVVLLALGRALPRVATQLSLSLQVDVPHCSFLFLCPSHK